MADGILYLDVDDEITSAAARIRRTEGSRVAVVLPYGSRVATSRINFRLLARDALTHEKRLSIVAPDGATRALAASAGLPVFASVAEYESSLEETGRKRPGAGAAAAAAAAGAATADVAEASVEPDVPADSPPEPAGDAVEAADDGAPGEGEWTAAAMAADAATADATAVIPTPVVEPTPRPLPATEPEPAIRPATSIPVIGSTRSIPRMPLLIGTAIVALAVLVVGVGAYILLPSATVVVTPHEQRVGPQTFAVVADTTATEPDAAAGVVPADLITLEVSAEDTFESTGVRVERTRAEGRVTFQNFDPVRANAIPEGSVVSTEGGIKFRTVSAVTLPAGELVQGTFVVVPSNTSVAIAAVRSGSEGNVPANSIIVVPPGEDPLFTKVRNPDPTTGGTETEFPRVEQEDVDAAMATLQEQLETSFQEQVADPSIAPPGATVFEETAALGPSTPTVDPAELVGQEVETFDLGLTASGTVIAVDPSPVEAIAQTRLESLVSPGFELVEGSVQIEPGTPVVEGQQVRFPVTVEASQVSIPDEAELEALILGKTEDEARTILAPFGDVELTLWPDWVTSVPTIDGRVTVEVRAPLPVEVIEPSNSPSPPPTAVPSAEPSTEPSAAASASP
jgi:Baseplate J-like protein